MHDEYSNPGGVPIIRKDRAYEVRSPGLVMLRDLMEMVNSKRQDLLDIKTWGRLQPKTLLGVLQMQRMYALGTLMEKMVLPDQTLRQWNRRENFIESMMLLLDETQGINVKKHRKTAEHAANEIVNMVDRTIKEYGGPKFLAPFFGDVVRAAEDARPKSLKNVTLAQGDIRDFRLAEQHFLFALMAGKVTEDKEEKSYLARKRKEYYRQMARAMATIEYHREPTEDEIKTYKLQAEIAARRVEAAVEDKLAKGRAASA